ncbi:S-layer homology domain-containing protein [Paenibacillus amylolyticus]|uniref:S-layer homology domain-containing protein n=1 Tax=Paenibacillus amylolyticus TaxID=1451 RepID=UPI003D2D81BB
MNCAKKLVTTLLITVMLFSSFNVVFGAAESSASDIEGNWAESQITKWIDKGFIHGYEDGSFKPNNTITRAEFFSLVNRSYGFTDTASVSFKDVTSSNWAYAEVSKAVKAGYIKGYRDGTIGANKPISRQEVAVIINDLLDLSNEASTGNHFTDSNMIALWAKNSVDAIVAKGILQGYDNNFNPNKPITRAEAVVALDRSVNARATDYSLAGTYGPEAGTQTIDGDVLISTAGVTLKNIIIKGNLLFSEGIQEGDVHLTNVTIKGVTRVEGGGVSTIYLKNTVTSTLIVDKKKGPVLIIVEGSTTVGEVTIHSPATLQETDITGNGFGKITLSERLPAGSKVGLKGTFDSLIIKGSGVQVDIPEGRIKDVIVAVTATGTTLNLGTDATIVNLFLDAVAKILGTGTIEKVTLSSVAKGGTTFETTIRLLDKVITVTPANPTAPATSPSTGGTDIVAPNLSNVTSGHIAGGDPVVGRSNENGYLYLVPSATPKTITSLNQSVAGLLGKKQSVTANVNATLNTVGLASGTYVVYAVDLANNISMASAEIVIGTNQLTVSTPVLSTEKMYDGTSSATVIADSLTGVAAGDHVTVSAAATYNDAIIGTGKTITVVYTLGGADAAKYIAPANYIIQTGAITAAQLTIGEPMLTLDEINGDSSLAVSAGSLVGVVPGEDVTVIAEAVYDTLSTQEVRPLTVVYTIAGVDSGKYIAPVNNTNYTVYVQSSADTGTIIDLITTFKVYDGTFATTAIAGSRVGSCGENEQGICPGDDVTVSASGVYDNENVGTNKKITISYTLLGPPVEVRNYSPPKDIEVVGVITAKQLMITDPTLILSKVYDGTLAANVTPGVLTNVIYGDDVQVNAVATYNNAAVGTSKVITIKYTLTGLDAGNYIAPATQTVGTGEITATP